MRRVIARENVRAGAKFGFAKGIERRLDRIEEMVQIAVILLDIKQAGDHFADSMALLQIGHRLDPVVRVVVGRQLV